MPGLPIVAVSRRRLLQVGGVGALGLSLPGLLEASAPRERGAASGPERSCIFIVQYGGASHIDSLDPKPHAPEDIRGPYKPIATRAQGMQLGELWPRLATLADKFAVIRSMTHSNGGHDGGMHVAMTGHSEPAMDTPYFGSIVARLRPATRNIPSYAWLQNLAGDVQPRYLTGGFLGPAYSPLRVGTDLDNPSAQDFRFTAFDPPSGMSAEALQSRRELLRGLNPPASDNAGGSGAAFGSFQEQAFDLVTGTEARQAFDLTREQDQVRDRYGRHPLGQNLLMARRLVEAGVRLVSVTAWCGVAEGEKFTNVQTWDMHGPVTPYIGSIFGTGSYGLGHALPCVDQSVSALLEDLSERGLLQNTLVVMVGEFGRSPKVYREGRDHWPSCYSALVAGASVRGGMVHGASDAQGAFVKDQPVLPEQFGATLFHALGIDHGTRLGLDGFTRPASKGEPIMELFG